MVFALVLDALTRVRDNGATFDRTIVFIANAFFAHLPFVGVQRALFDATLEENLIVVGLIVAWNAREIGALDRDAIRRRVILTVATFVPTYVIARILQHFGHSPRPISVLSLTPLTDAQTWAALKANFHTQGSFPSDHAALAAIATVAAFSLDYRAGWFFVVLSLCAGIDRIAAGFHWPSDIVGGLLLGTVVGSLALVAERWLDRPLRCCVGLFAAYPAPAAVVSVLFLAEFSIGFVRIQNLWQRLGCGRLFH